MLLPSQDSPAAGLLIRPARSPPPLDCPGIHPTGAAASCPVMKASDKIQPVPAAWPTSEEWSGRWVHPSVMLNWDSPRTPLLGPTLCESWVWWLCHVAESSFPTWDLSTSPGSFVYLDFNTNLWIPHSHFPFFSTLRPLTYYVRQLLPLKWIFFCKQVSIVLSTPWCPPFSFQSSARCGCTCPNTKWRHESNVFPPPPGRLFSPNVNQWIQIGTLKNKGLPWWLRW